MVEEPRSAGQARWTTAALEDRGLPRMTAEESLEHEASADWKHEFLAGEVLAMSEAIPPHARLGARLTARLVAGLEGTPWVPYTSNLGIRVDAADCFIYPDASVVCGEMEHASSDRSGRMASNPRVVFEIRSESTSAYDRGEKFKHYMKLESLEEYVLLEQDEPYVQSFVRQDDGTRNLASWSGTEEVARVRCLPLELPLETLYA